MRFHRVPDETVRRLPTYLRGLLLLAARGRRRVSSRELAAMLHANPPQIRKDLSYFGDFGTPGVGYDTEHLCRRLRTILHLDRPHKVALVGCGSLGAAILKHPGFGAYGLEIAAVFDKDPRKVGRKIRNITIQDASRIGVLKRQNVPLAILAVPAASAQNVALRLAAAGVSGILSFAPAHELDLPGRIKVIAIDIGMDLARLPYYLRAGSG